ncbi:MarR family winged helix-turn-helix transcriptional regulator [Stenotrophomonas sepilia]|uniref:MarR family winged helix-turn-helix transcriptional regulator n=1 Tax=Stenotrophomonas sepilia TaxID=2860290 RepID=UPI002E75B310|nr:MarR family winged helix-turn-helix transcriptional regulator [Stenotrophomonas sepilia]
MKPASRKFPEIEQLLALARLVRKRLDEQLDEIGLDTNMYLAMSEIDRLCKRGSHAIRANVAKSLGMSPTSMTGIYRRLDAADLIDEWQDEPIFFESTRQKYARLSDDGKKLLRRANDVWEKINVSYLGDLKDRQMKDFSSSMAVIRSALESNDGLA